MIPNNNRNIFTDKNVNCQSTGNQTFRLPITVCENVSLSNSNHVTQMQQSSRINNSYQLSSTNTTNSNNLNQIEVVKRIVAAMQEPQNHSMHLLNRQNQTPIPIVPTPVQMNQNSSSLSLDRAQMIRIPNNSQDSSTASNICQALYLIQQNLILQNDKLKQSNSQSIDICKQPVSSQSLIINNSANNLSTIAISSTPVSLHSQNATVLSLSNVDIQILEAFNRLNSQQNSKSINSASINPKLSIIESDSNMAQQLINAFQKQNPSTSVGTNSKNCMVIGHATKSVPSSLNNAVKPSTSFTLAPSNVNINANNELGNSLMKTQLNSKITEIPLLTKLLDKWSYNSENPSDMNRQFKLRELKASQSQKSVNSKPLSSSQTRPVMVDSDKYLNNNPVHQQGLEFLIGNNTSKPNAPNTKSLNTDTHQILRDSKEISYFMPSSTSSNIINNDDMINQHFNQSLRNKLDIKKSTSFSSDGKLKSKTLPPSAKQQNIENSKSRTLSNIISNEKTGINKVSRLYMDLEQRPDSTGNDLGYERSNSIPISASMIATSTDSVAKNQNNKLNIKETANKMVENLLKRSLNNYPTLKQYQKQVHVTTTPIQSKDVIGHSQCKSTSDTITTTLGSSSISEERTRPISNEVNQSTVYNKSEPSNLKDKMKSTNRVNPSKHDLPLKKRIMLDFNEKCADHSEPVTTVYAKVEPKLEMMPDNVKEECVEQSDENQNKIQRKRSHSNSLNDSNLSTMKKRRGRVPGTGKKQKLKEESRLREMAEINSTGTNESWHELALAVNKPPDVDKISAKTLGVLALEPLKISKMPFFQIGPCHEIAPRMGKCRSCRQNNTVNSSNDQSVNTADDSSSIKSGSRDSSINTFASNFCRFHGFRKLQFSAKGSLTHAGFCKSYEADSQDLSLWQMFYPLNSELSVSTASYLIESLSEIFCQMIESENSFVKDCYQSFEETDLKSIHRKKQMALNGSKPCSKPEFDELFWKRPVQGVRELCDVCDTSIFNTHLACRKCGYSVCVDCFDERQDKCSLSEFGDSKSTDEPLPNQSNGSTMNADMLPKQNRNNSVHPNTRGASKNRQSTGDHAWAVCTANRQPHGLEQFIKVELIPIKVISELQNRMHTVAKLFNLKLRCNCVSRSKSNELSSSLIEQASDSLPTFQSSSLSCENDLHLLADLVLKEGVNGEHKRSTHNMEFDMKEECNFGSLSSRPMLRMQPQPENVQGPPLHLSETLQKDLNSENFFSMVSVSPNFKIVRLHNADHHENLRVFQEQLLQAHPIIVSGCHKSMDLTLWTPEKFLEDFENTEPVTLVDCETELPVPKGTMKAFWEGFECVGKRISSAQSDSRPACLKLKDWPPSDDFNEILPQRCKDIMNNLPIKPYTSRQGEFNLAAHLPEFFVRPDLGPKLYNAYGMPRESKLGTTNLHLDIADAVNVMLYVGVPQDTKELEVENVMQSIKEAIVDDSVIKRAKTDLPGALWHIFLPKDVPKLRQFLYDLMVEQGEIIFSDHDPIHDQQFYLEQTMLNRLKKEYGVEGCAIVQFRGDAIFIPSGSPHQVRNLHSCMKVANDFVSPENIVRSLKITKEIRKLSITHANREDKLQAKNMIFHSMKDAITTLIVHNHRQQNHHPEKSWAHLKNSPCKPKDNSLESDEKESWKLSSQNTTKVDRKLNSPENMII